NPAGDRRAGDGNLAHARDTGAVAHEHAVGARLEGEAGLRGVLAAAAVAAGNLARRQRLACLVLHLHLATDDAAVAGDRDGHRRALAALVGITQQDRRFLAFVVEDHVEDAVAVEIDQAHGLRVEDALVQADLFGAVYESAVA